MQPIEHFRSILDEIGTERYGMEAVSQLQHALQSAQQAENSGATGDLITAALLHDIGHLVDNKHEGAAEAGIDRKHEQIGAAYLSRYFGTAVTEPVRLHVAAKQYLCATGPGYFDTLSPASIRSLELQGGVDGLDADRFIQQPFAVDAVSLRRWDDEAKRPDAETKSLDHFLGYAEEALA
ncbi:MAG: HD domain-containing protein [Alphaproteobacteria bacterium]